MLLFAVIQVGTLPYNTAFFINYCPFLGLCRTELGRYMFDMEALKKVPSFLLNIATAPLSKLSSQALKNFKCYCCFPFL